MVDSVDQYKCGCLWLATLDDLQKIPHVTRSRSFVNCQKISQLSCGM